MMSESPIVAADSSPKDLSNDRSSTVVAGVGSPFGDDQAGWRLIEMLERRANVPARLIRIDEATKLLDTLDSCHKLIIVDACRGVGTLGAITRLKWPDPRIIKRHGHSTHGVGVSDALRLAEQLGRLPSEVVIYGIEVGDCEPGREICQEVLQAVAQVEPLILAGLREAANA
jgi:hydrogenase maturation protease